jgi:hypothetical protein
MLGRYDDYSDYIFPIETSAVREVLKDKTLVFQRHKVFWLAPREALIWMSQTPLSDGFIVSWEVASDRSFLLTKGAVATAVNEGMWQVVELEGGGVRIAHEVSVDAGGGLPEWIVSFFRTRGFIRIMNNIHVLAAAEQTRTKP